MGCPSGVGRAWGGVSPLPPCPPCPPCGVVPVGWVMPAPVRVGHAPCVWLPVGLPVRPCAPCMAAMPPLWGGVGCPPAPSGGSCPLAPCPLAPSARGRVVMGSGHGVALTPPRRPCGVVPDPAPPCVAPSPCPAPPVRPSWGRVMGSPPVAGSCLWSCLWHGVGMGSPHSPHVAPCAPRPSGGSWLPPRRPLRPSSPLVAPAGVMPCPSPLVVVMGRPSCVGGRVRTAVRSDRTPMGSVAPSFPQGAVGRGRPNFKILRFAFV